MNLRVDLVILSDMKKAFLAVGHCAACLEAQSANIHSTSCGNDWRFRELQTGMALTSIDGNIEIPSEVMKYIRSNELCRRLEQTVHIMGVTESQSEGIKGSTARAGLSTRKEANYD